MAHLILNVRKIKRLMVDLDLNQGQLAAAAGMTEQTVSNMLAGKGFKAGSLVKLAKPLAIDPRELLEWVADDNDTSPHWLAP